MKYSRILTDIDMWKGQEVRLQCMVSDGAIRALVKRWMYLTGFDHLAACRAACWWEDSIEKVARRKGIVPKCPWAKPSTQHRHYEAFINCERG